MSAVFPVTNNNNNAVVVSSNSVVASGQQPQHHPNVFPVQPGSNSSPYSANNSGGGVTSGPHYVPAATGPASGMPPPYTFRYNYIQAVPPHNVMQNQMHFQVYNTQALARSTVMNKNSCIHSE